MVTKENADSLIHQSHLFMLRVWFEYLGDGQVGWRGKVQHVNSGEVHYFRDWKTLEIYINGWITREYQSGEENRENKR